MIGVWAQCSASHRRVARRFPAIRVRHERGEAASTYVRDHIGFGRWRANRVVERNRQDAEKSQISRA